jgi:hypothetical protein
LGVADGDSSSAGVDFFFFGEGDADGVGEDFFEGVGVTVGDFFLLAVVTVLFGVFGVGVGVAKTFFSAAPRDCSAGLAVSIGKEITAIKMRSRKNM